MNTQVLTLTADEVMHLTDAIKNHDHGTEDMAACAYPLILKLGGCYVELFANASERPTDTISVACTEPEAWLLRSKVTSYDKTANDALFGVKLLVKLYRALLAHNAPDMPSAVAEATDEVMTSDRREALRQLAGGDQ